jgi:quercetin dioxygenase-like cupin family protein
MQLEHIRSTVPKPPKQDDARRTLEAEGFEVVCWSDPPGRTYAPHAHERDESLWMIAGAMTFEIDGRSYRLEAGDRLMLPRGVMHAAQAHDDGARYLIGER